MRKAIYTTILAITLILSISTTATAATCICIGHYGKFTSGCGNGYIGADFGTVHRHVSETDVVKKYLANNKRNESLLINLGSGTQFSPTSGWLCSR